jgi:TonB family protein
MREPQQLFATLAPPRLGEELRRLLGGFGANLVMVLAIVMLSRQQWQTASTSPGRKVVLVRLPDLRQAKIPPRPPLPPTPRPARKAPLPVLSPAMPPTRPVELPAPPVLAATPAAPITPTVPATLPSLDRPKPVVGSFEGPAVAVKSSPPRPAVVVSPAFERNESPQTAVRRTDSVRVGALEQADRQTVVRNRPELAAAIGFQAAGTTPLRGSTQQATLESGFDTRFKGERPRARRQVEEGSFEPVEILSKPKPQYTEAARRLGIEGEVSVRILFGSDGKLKVLGIVQGLGHGLDENAASAAARIEFRPARRGGQPVEQAAVVRVQFYLAQ